MERPPRLIRLFFIRITWGRDFEVALTSLRDLTRFLSVASLCIFVISLVRMEVKASELLFASPLAPVFAAGLILYLLYEWHRHVR